METLGLIGILVAIVLIIFLAMKGYNILFIAPITSIIVIVTNQMDFFASLIGPENSFMKGLTGFILSFFAVFMLGAILAKYMDASGAAQSIAEGILKVTGTEKPFPVLVALFLITAVLTYGGISLFVVLFVIIPLAKPLFKKLDISWNLIGVPVFLGFGTLTMTMLPGAPSIQNVVPTAYLGTTLTAAPVIGIVAAIVSVVYGMWFIKYSLNKSLKKGETYSTYLKEDTKELELKTNVPPFISSVLPIVVLIAIILVGSAMKVPNIVLIGLGIAIILSAVLFHKYLPSQKAVLNEGASGSIAPIFATAAAVAFGVVVTTSPAFKTISDFILNMPGNPLIGLSTASLSLAAITGSASGGLGIVFGAFAEPYLAMGLDPEVMHRVAAIASSAFTMLPHSGVFLTFIALSGLTHENSFKITFNAMTWANVLALIAALALGIFMS